MPMNTLRRALWMLVALAPLAVLTGCQKELYGDISEVEATEMWAILLRNDIDSDKVSGRGGTYSLHVEKSQIPEAVSILKECGLPRTKYASSPNVDGGFMPSPEQERVQTEYLKNQELAETLSFLDGVIIARVHIVLPESTPFAETTANSSASVLIKHRADVDLENVKSQIKLTVAKGVRGLDYEHVTVTMQAAEQSSRCTGVGSSRRTGMRYAQAGPIPKAALWVIAGALALFALGVVMTSRHRATRSNGHVLAAHEKDVARPVSRHEP